MYVDLSTVTAAKGYVSWFLLAFSWATKIQTPPVHNHCQDFATKSETLDCHFLRSLLGGTSPLHHTRDATAQISFLYICLDGLLVFSLYESIFLQFRFGATQTRDRGLTIIL